MIVAALNVVVVVFHAAVVVVAPVRISIFSFHFVDEHLFVWTVT